MGRCLLVQGGPTGDASRAFTQVCVFPNRLPLGEEEPREEGAVPLPRLGFLWPLL